jgi:hypothetical protein
MAGRDRLDGTRQVVDAPHDLELFADKLLVVLPPIGFGLDEKGRPAGIAIRRLHHQISSEPGLVSELQKLVISLCFPECIWRTLDAGLITELGSDDLRIDVLAQLDRGKGDVEA